MELVSLAINGQRPRCGEPGAHDPWFSDEVQERATAAAWCTGCPVFDRCHEAAEANGERFGVWAGVDRTVAQRKREAA